MVRGQLHGMHSGGGCPCSKRDESPIRHLYGTLLYVSYRRGFRGGLSRRPPPPFRAIMIREGGGLFPVDLSV